MAIVKPFKGLRTPNQEVCEELACLPYDVMNSEEAAQMAEGKPKSLLHVTRAAQIYILKRYIIKVWTILRCSRKKVGWYRMKNRSSIFMPRRWTAKHNMGLSVVQLAKII